MNSRDVLAKTPSNLTIPVREVSTMESITLGFYMDFFTTGDEDKDGVFGGAGMGSPWVQLKWKGRTLGIHTGELLAAWVATFDPDDAKAIREAFKFPLAGEVTASVRTA